MNNSVRIFWQLTNTGLQDELAEQTLKAMCRKFSSSAKTWMRQITWLLSKDQPDAVKRALDKSFNALPSRKHIKVLLFSCRMYCLALFRLHTHACLHCNRCNADREKHVSLCNIPSVPVERVQCWFWTVGCTTLDSHLPQLWFLFDAF